MSKPLAGGWRVGKLADEVSRDVDPSQGEKRCSDHVTGALNFKPADSPSSVLWVRPAGVTAGRKIQPQLRTKPA